MSSTVDVRGLALRGEQPAQAARQVRWRSIAARYVLPAVVLLGFLALAGWAGRERFLSAKSVTVVPVLAVRGEVNQAGVPLFQAAGWIEPRPTATHVTALAHGVVEKLFVVEGQPLKAGDKIAQLVDADARLALADAEAQLALEQSGLERAEGALTAAEVNLRQPLKLQADLASAEAELAAVQTELTNLPFEVRAAEARLKLATQVLDGKKRASEAVGARAVQQAEADVEVAQASLEQMRKREGRLANQVKVLERRRAALDKQLELKTEETRMLSEAKAEHAAAQARVRKAQVAVDAARLGLERMLIRAPIAGKVLQLAAPPGTRMMGLTAESEQEASTVVTMYDPARLQVRADVRLEDVGRVQTGQPATIETSASPKPLKGQVLASTSLVDTQKNTLQVKVSIDIPPPVLKPDMLVRVTFLAPSLKRGTSKDEQLRLLAPRELIQGAGQGTHVWLADRTAGRALRKAVKLGSAAQGDMVEIVEGLQVGDRLIVAGGEGLEDGQRIRITGEDPHLGSSRRAASSGGGLHRLYPHQPTSKDK